MALGDRLASAVPALKGDTALVWTVEPDLASRLRSKASKGVKNASGTFLRSLA
jgi:hypothetical protein